MDSDSASQTLGLLHYLRVLRRRWYTIPIGALLGVLAAVSFLVVTPTTTTAFTAIDLTVVTSDPFNLARPAPDLLNRTTEEQTARSATVIAPVADELDRSIADIRGAVQATVLPESTVLQLRYTAGSEDEAVRGADALAASFLAIRSDANAERVDRVLTQYDANVADLRDQLSAVNRRIAQAEGRPAVLAAAQADQVAVQTELDSVLQERSRMSGIDTNGGSIIASAEDNRVEVSPNQPLVLATGLLAGVVLGLIGAFAIDGIDRRIRDRIDIEESDSGPVLAILRGRTSSTPADGDDIDAIRSVREHLLAAIPSAHAIVSVAEVAAHNEPTDVAVNLALEISEAGVTTDLVLAEYPPSTVAFIRASLGMRLSVPTIPDASVFESLSHPLLRMFVPGPTADGQNPSTSFVSGLTRRADADAATMTVIALPPHASRSLILAAGRLGTAVITVCGVGSTRKSELGGLIEDLDSVNADLKGSVLLKHRRPWISRRSSRSKREEIPAEVST